MFSATSLFDRYINHLRKHLEDHIFLDSSASWLAPLHWLERNWNVKWDKRWFLTWSWAAIGSVYDINILIFRRCYIKKILFTCWISSWSCVILSICDNSCSIARFSFKRTFLARRSEFRTVVYVLGQQSTASTRFLDSDFYFLSWVMMEEVSQTAEI